jgi:PIN domain nuclease of toxin-antitoxin system
MKVLRYTHTLLWWFADDGFAHLPMTYRHSLLAGSFTQPHRDPFDRMLAAQALSENATILGRDLELKIFGVALAW